MVRQKECLLDLHLDYPKPRVEEPKSRRVEESNRGISYVFNKF